MNRTRCRTLGESAGRWGHAAGFAAAFGLVAALAPACARAGASASIRLAAETTQLPSTPIPIAPLHRRSDGSLEVVTPKGEKTEGVDVCTRHALCVGAGQAYPSLTAALAAAKAGDTIEIVAGTYRESAKIALKNVTVRGVGGRPHFDCKGMALADDLACLVVGASGVTLEELEISGAAVPIEGGGLAACVRNEPNLSFALKRITCHASQNGVIANGGDIVIEDSEFYENGGTREMSNASFLGKCTVTVRGSTFRDTRIGDEFRSRCKTTRISDSTFRSTAGALDLDISDGGDAFVYRSTLTKNANAASEMIIGFASDSCVDPGDLVLKEVHIVNSHPNAKITNFGKCDGRAIVMQGVTVDGLPLKEFGYVYTRQ